MKKPILIGLILLVIAITIPAIALTYQGYLSSYYTNGGYYYTNNYYSQQGYIGQRYQGGFGINGYSLGSFGMGYMYSMMQNMFAIMQGNFGYYQGEGNSYLQIPISQAIQEMYQVPPYTHVYPNNDTIVFTSTYITLIVLAMGHERAINITGYIPPTYAHASHDVFVIYGLINPTLIIPSGAVIHLIFINLDDDMYHNFVVTTVSPPYPYNVMPEIMMEGGMMMGGFNSGRTIFYMPFIHYANYAEGYAYEYTSTFTLTTPGIYWYPCTYPGHAEMGMYGEIIVMS